MVTATKPRVDTTPCPHCGAGFRNLGAHVRYCKQAPTAASAPPVGAPTPETLLQAQHQEDTRTTKENMYLLTGSPRDAGITPVIQHTTAGKVLMYKPFRDSKGNIRSWRRTPIKTTNREQALKDGFRESCGACGGSHGNEPNECSAEPKRKYRVCPICQSRVYDALPFTEPAVSTDVMAIQDNTYAATTPEQRTKANLETHIRAWHPQEGLAFGLQPITTNTVPQVGENIPR